MVEQVTKVTHASHLVASILLAFSADPVVRWLFPDPDDYLRSLGAIARIHADRTAEIGGAYGLTDGRGAAFWYIPGESPPADLLGPVFADAGMLDKMQAVFAESARFEPQEPHWYLRQIGIDPTLQGTGLGGVLLEAAYTEIDAVGSTAYLEATSARGRNFYAAHGFEVLGEFTAAGSPPLWAMARMPNR